jgi:hypothetical protein
MANSPQGNVFTPGTIVDQDVETLLNLQLMSRGVDVNDVEDIKKRVSPKWDSQNGRIWWELDGKVILTFQREMISEAVLGYSLKIERLIQVAKFTH